MRGETVIRAATRFRAVLNNYHPSDDELLKRLWNDNRDGFKFMVWGYEVGEQGTKHFQAYFVFERKKSLRQLKKIFVNPGWHFNNCDMSHSDNYKYCTKDGIWNEFGTLPEDSQQGKRTDLIKFRDWCKEEYRTDRDIAEHFPDIFLKYPSSKEMSRLLAPPPKFHDESMEITWRPWQLSVIRSIEKKENDDRSVEFFIDEKGGIGKTFLAKWLQDKFTSRVQLISNGASKDIAYILDETKDTFIFNVPKNQMEFVSYNIFEGIKDQFVMSGKYQSTVKYFRNKTRVIVFGNEFPDNEKMSEGRIKVTKLYNP